MLKKNMFRKTFILASIVAIFVVGCSSDQSYKREIEGNENYLKASELKPLIVPQGVTVPNTLGNYTIYKAAAEGDLGKKIDIRPPTLPIPTIADSDVSYANGNVYLNSPNYASVWNNIPTILQRKNIPIQSNDSNSIKTGAALFNLGGGGQAIEATYSIDRQVSGSRDYIAFRLTSLQRAGQVITAPADIQRYSVDFFNMVMDEIAAMNNNSHTPTEQ